MKNTFKKLGVRVISLLVTLIILLTVVPFSAFATTYTNNYSITVTPSTTNVKAGDTVTLTAKVTKNGTEITDLAAAGLYL